MAGTEPLDPRIRDAIREALASMLPSTQVGTDVGNVLTPIFPPLGSVPASCRFLMARDMVVTVRHTVATPAPTVPIQLGDPMIIYAVSAQAIDGASAPLALSQFTVDLRSGTEHYASDPVILSTWAGAGGGVPRIIGGRGWYWTAAMNLQLQVINLIPAVSRVDVLFHGLLLKE